MKKVILNKLNEMLKENPFYPPVTIKDLKIKTKQIDTGNGIIEVVEHHVFDNGLLVLSERFLGDYFVYGQFEQENKE